MTKTVRDLTVAAIGLALLIVVPVVLHLPSVH